MYIYAQYHAPTTPQGGGGTVPHPHHTTGRGGGHYHTPTTPQGGGAQYYGWPMTMAGGRGVGTLDHRYIYIYVYVMATALILKV